ncbi:hypothetical protein [Mesorhizobium sp. A556]
MQITGLLYPADTVFCLSVSDMCDFLPWYFTARLEMIDGLFVILIGGSYFLGHYAIAFWLTIFAIANGALAVAKTISNPSWYIQKRVEAGLDPVLDIKGLLLAKAVIVVPLCIVAFYLAGPAGYR